MKSLPLLRFELQRTTGDCGIACISMITGIPYEDVLVSVAEDRRYGALPHRTGLWLTNMMAIAKKLGCPLRKKRVCNFVMDKGILAVEMPTLGHVVVLMSGLIFEPDDASVWLPIDYKRRHRAKFGSILIPNV